MHALVQALPCFISQIVISHRGECNPQAGTTPIGDTADIAFGIRVQPLSDQQKPDRRHPRPDRPARWARRRRPARRSSWPGCRCWRPRPTPISPTAAGGCRWSGCWRSALVLAAVYRSVRRALVPLIPVADGDRLVGAGGRRAGRPAQPDVGDAGRARDRDRDRVQRDPLGALRDRAARRPVGRRGAAAHLPADGRGGARLRRHGDRGLRRPGDRRAAATRRHRPDLCGSRAPRLRARDGGRPAGRARRA